jgi:hypothetical protein
MGFAAAATFRIAEYWIPRYQRIFLMIPVTTMHGYVGVGTRHPTTDLYHATRTARLSSQRKKNGVMIFISASAVSASLIFIH